MIPLEHTELQVFVRVLQIPNPGSSLSPLFNSLLLSPPSRSNPISGPPYPDQVLAGTLETDPLDCNGSFIFRTAYRQILGLTPESAR